MRLGPVLVAPIETPSMPLTGPTLDKVMRTMPAPFVMVTTLPLALAS